MSAGLGEKIVVEGARGNRVISTAIQMQDGHNVNYSFDSVSSLLQARPEYFNAITAEKAEAKLTQNTAGFFFQDNWMILPSLTLNLGLRYEFQSTPQESKDEVSALAHLMGNEVIQGVLITIPTKKSFSPRFGFA